MANNAFNDEISYMTLFPNTEFNNLTEAYSVYGAGAYFVALMDIANKYVKPAPGVSEDLSLNKRRDDLWDLQVTQANIDNEVPYLGKVLELLRKYKGNGAGFVPFNVSAAKVQTYLQANNTNLAALAPSFTKEGYGGAWAMTQIGLTQSDAKVLKDATSANDWYNNTLASKSDPTIFKIITGLNDEGILALVYNGIPFAERGSKLKNLYINSDNPDTCLGFENNKLTNLKDVKQLKRIQNFLILSKKTGWDYATLYEVLVYLDLKETTIDPGEINQLAQISYLADKWGKTPVQVAVWASACAVAYSATPSLQQQLVALSPIAQALNCPMELLLGLFSSPNSTFAAMLNAIFELQVQKQTMAKAGVGLPDYLTSLALAGVSILDDKTFSDWYSKTKMKLTETETTFSKPGESADLQLLLFQQWVHEFCVFTGLKELETGGVIQGIFSASNDDTDCFKKANNFFMRLLGTPIEIYQNFFNNLIPHILFVQKLNLDATALLYIGYQIGTDPFNIPPTSRIKLNLYANFTFVYAHVNADKKSDFVAACWTSIGAEGLPGAFIQTIGFPDNFKGLYDSLFGKDTSVTISALAQLCDCFAFAQSTTLDAVKLYGYTQVIVADNIPAIPEITPTDRRYAQYRTYYGQALEAERDYLVPIVLLAKSSVHPDINSPDHLSDFYLIDVEMSGIMDIAPMREATDAVQTYLMRCNRGLEQVTVVRNEDESKGISARQWEWIPNFRIWQAERILETYPQNYLQPDVRSTATPQFKDMLNELQGTQLTNDKAETALLNYLDEWIDLINTDMVDAAAYKTFSDYFQKDVETLFLISKSKVKANTFYYAYKDTDLDTRQYHWAPWQEITAKINADTVSCIYAFNRLHIFWSEISSVTDTDPTVTNGKYTLYSITIKCIYHNIDGSWSTPQTITESMPFYLENTRESTLLQGTIFTKGAGGFLSYGEKNITVDLEKKKCYVDDQVIGEIIENGLYFYSIHFNNDDMIVVSKNNEQYNYYEIEIKGDVTKIKVNGSNVQDIQSMYSNSSSCWQKLYPIEVWNKKMDTTFIQVLFGPYVGADSPSCFLPIFSQSCDTDFKLQKFKENLKKNASLLKYQVSMFFAPITLDNSLKQQYVDINIPYICNEGYPSVTYTGNNIVKTSAYGYITSNYKGTQGIVQECKKPEYKIFNDDFSKGVINKYFAIRNLSLSFYIEINNNGFLFAQAGSLIKDSSYIFNGSFIQDRIVVVESPLLTERIFSKSINQLRIEAHNEGLEIMLPQSQGGEIGLPMTKFSSLKPNTEYVVPPAEDCDNKIDFNGAFGIYAHELYFNAPMAIAKLLANQMQYDDVRRWYNYVVDLTNANAPWSYGGFRKSLLIVGEKSERVTINGRMLLTSPAIGILSPCVVFNLKTKKIHIVYLTRPGSRLCHKFSADYGKSWSEEKQLIDAPCGVFGIELINNDLKVYYSQDPKYYSIISPDDGTTWKSPVEEKIIPASAEQQTILVPTVLDGYINSFDPDIISENSPSIYQHWTIAQYINFILDFADNEFRQETWESLSAALQLYFEAEDLLGEAPEIKDLQSDFDKDSANRTYAQNAGMSFGTPTNQTLKALWDRVNDRLYKLRNGLNINGERQMPSMYGTAIDPARLLLAAQNGGINPYDSSSLSAKRSAYRFRDMAPHTESLINLVVEFGGQLFSALVQKDNEQLQVLQATHQINMLNVVAQTYQYQIDEATNEIVVLQANLDSVAHQKNYYDGLINKGVNTLESKALGHLTGTKVAQIVASDLRIRAFAAHFIPTIYGLADGGFQPGSAIDSAATVANEIGQALQTTSQILNTTSEYIRRAEEWHFQSEQAQYSIDQINASLASATLRLNIAQENLKQYNLQVSQANEVYNYLKNKFTSAELYNWMSGQMASLYFTAYQLANTSLHTLQEAYQYELDLTTDNFIPTSTWNSMQKGLLAGETLKLALARMQDAYFAKNKRRQEVEAIISLKKKGYSAKDVFNFTIKKSDLTTSSGIVKIKSIAVSIPAVVGPYETFGATLTKDGGESITISRGIEDMGIFVDEMNDGRYLPFEGLKIDDEGTSWTLTIPKAKDKNISDVILNIKFTVK